MTLREFYSKEKKIREELDKEFNEIFLDLNDKYSKYVGKKVLISVHNSIINKDYEGFFEGIVKYEDFFLYTPYALNLLVYNIRKDGTKGKRVVHIYGTNKALDNFDIKLI